VASLSSVIFTPLVGSVTGVEAVALDAVGHHSWAGMR
jgi:hypothetical protein